MDPITLTSTEPPATVYACGRCRTIFGLGQSLDDAERCCTCAGCGRTDTPVKTSADGKLRCAGCTETLRASAAAALADRRRDAPIVFDHDGPVYVESTSPQFHESAHAAAEAAWDQCDDPGTFDMADVVAHPCTTRPAHTPNLDELVTESWSENFDDGSDCELTQATATQLAAVQRLIEAEAPICWDADLSRRLALPSLTTAGAPT
jgi:hypothetical protein